MTNKSKNTTIDRLKTMSKNSRGNLVRNNLRILKYGIIGYGRNIWLSITSTFVMTLTLILLFVTVIASMILSVRFGSTNVPLSDILSEVSAFISTGRPAETASSMILWQIRIPRTIFAAFCGMGLSLCGLVLQTMTRNDLADPYVLGVSSGASTGAVIAIIWGWFSFFGNYNVSAGAFIGAAVSTIIVTMCAGKSTSPIRLILVGMGVSALFSALTMMIIYGAKHEAQVRSAMFWLLGSLSGMQWSSLPTVAAAVFIMLAAVWILRSDLDLMLLGEGEAEYLGMNRKKLQLFIVILSSLIVAILVSKAGIIGFIGLITPHLARTAAGPSHGRLALFSALIGAIVMIWADVLSRALFAPEEVPIGVLTSIVGAPIFLWIVTHRYGEVQP